MASFLMRSGSNGVFEVFVYMLRDFLVKHPIFQLEITGLHMFFVFFFNLSKWCMYLLSYFVNYTFPQVLVYDDIPETELIWATSEPGKVTDGAVVAGQRSNGDPLYVAKANGEAGHYDPNKTCVEYHIANFAQMCRTPYFILTLRHSEFLNRICTLHTHLLLLGHMTTVCRFI